MIVGFDIEQCLKKIPGPDLQNEQSVPTMVPAPGYLFSHSNNFSANIQKPK